MISNTQKYDITWVGILEIKDRKVLMARESGKNLFQLPGGGQEAGESYLETLHREISEELGVKLNNIKPYDDFILPGRHEGVFIRFLIFTADLVGQIKPGDNIEEIRWIDSKYEKDSLDIGNPTKLKLFPRLLTEGIID